MSTFKKVIRKIFWCFTDYNERNWIYKTVSLLGLIFRVCFLPLILPNIFEVVSEFFIGQLNLPQWAYEILIRIALFLIDNLCLFHIFYWLSFLTVGNSYESGTCPWWGSVCYSFYYTFYWLAPVLLFRYFEWWVIALIFGLYALFSTWIYIGSALLKTLPDKWLFILRLVIHCLVFAAVLILLFLHKGNII